MILKTRYDAINSGRPSLKGHVGKHELNDNEVNNARKIESWVIVCNVHEANLKSAIDNNEGIRNNKETVGINI